MADFLGKITGGIDKGIKTISSKSKEFIEITRLKGEIKDLEATLQIKFSSLGKKVFEMTNKGVLNEKDLMIDCGEIASLYRKITQTEETMKNVELEALKARYGADVNMCAKCGSPNKAGDKFCNSCGSTLSAEVKSDAHVCPTCGATIKEEAKFCTRCGGKIV